MLNVCILCNSFTAFNWLNILWRRNDISVDRQHIAYRVVDTCVTTGSIKMHCLKFLSNQSESHPAHMRVTSRLYFVFLCLQGELAWGKGQCCLQGVHELQGFALTSMGLFQSLSCPIPSNSHILVMHGPYVSRQWKSSLKSCRQFLYYRRLKCVEQERLF